MTRRFADPSSEVRDAHAVAAIPAPQGAAWRAFRTLFYKEVLRFWKVSFQTIAAPVLTSVLYLLVFGHVLDARIEPFAGVRYKSFLIPGLVMMSVLQNAFANTSSSLIQSKIMGSLVFLLLPPISSLQFFAAYVLAAALRGAIVGSGVFLVTLALAPVSFHAPGWILVFGFFGAALLGVLGLIAGILSDKFDQLAAFQNFIILPATFLSGVFYSVHTLPAFWQTFSRFNPFFYMVDGFRFGFFAQSDMPPWTSLAVVASAFLATSAIALAMLRRGTKLRG